MGEDLNLPRRTLLPFLTVLVLFPAGAGAQTPDAGAGPAAYSTQAAFDAGLPETPVDAGREIPEQPVNLRGTVRERGSRSPIPAASVTVAPCDEKGEAAPGGEESETFTNDTGAFEFRGLKPGRYKVIAAAADYYRFETVDEISPGKLTEVTYYVQRLSYGMFETVVKAPKEKKEVAKITLDIEEIMTLPGTGNDALRAVQDLPGVARTPMNTGGIAVRGSPPRDTLVYLDNVQLPLLFHYMGLTSTYNSLLLDSLDFYPGGFSARFGDATGGLIELKSRNPRDDRFHGMVDVNLYEASAVAESPVTKNSSFYAAFRRSYIDAVLGLVAGSFGGLSLTTAPWYYDFQAKFRYSKSKRDELSVQAYGSCDVMRMVSNQPMNAGLQGSFSSETQFYRLTAAWTRRATDFTATLTLSPGYTYSRTGVFSYLDVGVMQLDLFIRGDLSMDFTRYLTVNYGGNIDIGRFSFNGLTPRIPGKSGEGVPMEMLEKISWGGTGVEVTPAVYLEGVIRPAERWKLVPGVRVTYYDLMSQLTADPRFAAWFEATKKVTLKLQAGLYHGYPNLPFLIPGLGNPDLHAESSAQYSVGVEWKIIDLLGLDFQVYYKDMFDLAVRTDTITVINGKPVMLYYTNQGVGFAYGADLMLRHEMSKWFYGWLAYSLLVSMRKDGPGQPYRPSAWDQTHNLTLVGVFRLPKNWEIGLRFRLVSGNPYTPFGPTSYYDSDYATYWPMTGAPNSARMPLFNQLDFRVTKRFIFDWWMLAIYLDVQNVYNYRSVEAVMYNYDYTSMKYLQGLPILPTLGLTADF